VIDRRKESSMMDGMVAGSVAAAASGPAVGIARRLAARLARLRPVARFVGHYVEMVLAMVVGMAVLGIPVGAIAQAQGYDNVYHQLPELGAIVMTAIMTGPMALWMAVRGHDRQMIGEMSAAMIVPVAVLILAAGLGVIAASSLPMLSDPLMYASMLVVMLARWRMYAGLGHGHGAHA
jgi:flagellar biosynthetic protein FliP